MRVRVQPVRGIARAAIWLLSALCLPPEAAAAGFEAEGIARHVRALGSDEFEGRAVGTPGGERTVEYLVAELTRLGLEPAGTDGYLQPVPLHGMRPRPSSDLVIVSGCGAERPRLDADYQLFAGGVSTFLPRPVDAVFVGYGIVAPEFDHSDYLGVDVNGKVAVVLSGEPVSSDPDYFDADRPTIYSAPESKQRTALSRGARGTLILPSGQEPPFKDWDYWRRQFAFEHVTLAYGVPRHFAALLRPEFGPALFCGAATSFAEVLQAEKTNQVRSFELDSAVRFRGVFDQRDFLSHNVAGVLRGSDPELADSYVLVTAHHDHLGIGPPLDGDDVYNGVVDNALGVAGVLELARALAQAELRPRRSILFVFLTGEEHGLLGASYYTDHPLVPLHTTVANVNVDGLAHFGPFRDVLGVGAQLSTLGEVLAATAAELGLALSPIPAEFERIDSFAFSDQAAFAEAGVPAILVQEGFDWPGYTREEALRRFARWGRSRYHTPRDDLSQPLDFAAAARHLELIGSLVGRLADDDDAPTWHPGSAFARARLRSQAEGR
jgi:hypothetical protein